MAHGQGGAEISAAHCPTLTCNHEAPICFDSRQDPIAYGDIAGPCGSSAPQSNAVAYPIQNATRGKAQNGLGIAGESDPMYTLDVGSQHGVAVASVDVMPTMVSGGSTDASHNQMSGQFREQYLTPTSSANVRRLTPVERERLQGFPDNHTRIPWRGKAPEDCPDGPRYKAIGNSKAVPVIQFVGARVLMELLRNEP